MGLFDFAKEVGRQIFDTDAEAADNIRQPLEVKMSGIKNLDVQFDDGVATISGECAYAADKNMVALIVGDIKGVESVNIDNLTAPPVVEEVERVYHVVVSGERVGHVARR